MRRLTSTSWGVIVTAGVLGMAMAGRAATQAPQAPPAQTGRGAAPPAAAPRPMIPAAASSIVLRPDAFVGENVSVTATVESVLSKSAFTVDQDRTKATGQDLLVITAGIYGTLPPNTYVTVQGTVITFDPAEVTRRLRNYTLDLAPDVVAKFQGKPAVIATVVLTPDMTDLARRPLTPEELAFDKVMKQVSASNTALRGALEASSAEQATQNVTILKKAFADAEAFFKARGTADAMGWAQEAQKHVEAVERAVMGGQWDQAKTANASLGQMCQQCHGVHREREADGNFRVRPGR